LHPDSKSSQRLISPPSHSPFWISLLACSGVSTSSIKEEYFFCLIAVLLGQAIRTILRSGCSVLFSDCICCLALSSSWSMLSTRTECTKTGNLSRRIAPDFPRSTSHFWLSWSTFFASSCGVCTIRSPLGNLFIPTALVDSGKCVLIRTSISWLLILRTVCCSSFSENLILISRIWRAVALVAVTWF